MVILPKAPEMNTVESPFAVLPTPDWSLRTEAPKDRPPSVSPVAVKMIRRREN